MLTDSAGRLMNSESKQPKGRLNWQPLVAILILALSPTIAPAFALPIDHAREVHDRLFVDD
jgi:hypothetical protein